MSETGPDPVPGRRAFPVVYATDVTATARFWERLGFTRFFHLPADMPWGERIATVADPDGNPVTLANQARVTPS